MKLLYLKNLLGLIGEKNIESILLLKRKLLNVLNKKLLDKLKRQLIKVLHLMKLAVLEIRLILLDKRLMKC